MSSSASVYLRRSGLIDGTQSSAPQNDVGAARLERELHGVAHGQLRKEACGLERTSETAAAPAGVRSIGCVAAEQLHAALRRT